MSITIVRVLFFLVVVSLPLGSRLLVAQATPQFNQYTSIFLYGSDVLLFIFLLVTVLFPSKRVGVRRTNSYVPLTFFILFSVLSLFFAPSFILAGGALVRLVLLIAFAVAVWAIVSKENAFVPILFIISCLAVAQSVVGILQFQRQGNLGLTFLGESPISVSDPATSRIVVEGVRVMRAYGTFPHPNVFAAFLLLGVVSLSYFWLKIDWERIILFLRQKKRFGADLAKALVQSVVIAAALFLVLYGLALAFSRTAWGIFALYTLVVLACGIFLKPYRRQALKLVAVVIISCAFIIVNVGSFIFSRAHVSSTEPSVVQRIAYNRIGAALVQTHPLGVGIGNQVFSAITNKLYEQQGIVSPWYWQPIHNLYLLIASEIGVAGLLAFLVFLALILKRALKQRTIESGIAFVMLAILLLTGATDHFLWTLQPGRLMLWLVIGLVLVVGNTFAKKPS